MNVLARLLRAPAFHFLVLGGLLFALDGRAPAPAGRALGPAASDEDILLEEALALRLDRQDRLVRERLAGLVRVVEAGEVEDADGLARDARRLGLERHDLVVRRHLVQAMQLALAHGGSQDFPDEAALAAYLERHRERFMQPARLRFSHVFFARDRAGEPAGTAARAAVARLGSAAPAPAAPGDAFLSGSEIAGSEPELTRTFGAAFTAALAGLPAGRWAGPVESPFGWHVVLLHERIPPALPALDAVRARVVHGVLAERAASRLAERLAERRARHAGAPS
jgi:parvulin-like peptidyl-prolyl isomerase